MTNNRIDPLELPINTGRFIGYTQGGGENQLPTLYFENGRFTQEHEIAGNVGWHPENPDNLTRANVRFNGIHWEIVDLFGDDRDEDLRDQIHQGLRRLEVINPQVTGLRRRDRQTFLLEVSEDGGVHPSRGRLNRPNDRVTDNDAQRVIERATPVLREAPLEEFMNGIEEIRQIDQNIANIADRIRNNADNARLQEELTALNQLRNDWANRLNEIVNPVTPVGDGEHPTFRFNFNHADALRRRAVRLDRDQIQRSFENLNREMQTALANIRTDIQNRLERGRAVPSPRDPIRRPEFEAGLREVQREAAEAEAKKEAKKERKKKKREENAQKKQDSKKEQDGKNKGKR